MMREAINMKITERCLTDYFSRSTLCATEDKLVWHYKSLKLEFTREYSYADLSPITKKMKVGVTNAANCSILLFVISAPMSILANRTSHYLYIAVLLFLIASAFVFLLQFKKHEEIFFYTKEKEFAFSFSEEHHQEFLAFVMDKIIDKTSATASVSEAKK